MANKESKAVGNNRPITQKDLLASARSVDDNINKSDVKVAQSALAKISKQTKK